MLVSFWRSNATEESKSLKQTCSRWVDAEQQERFFASLRMAENIYEEK